MINHIRAILWKQLKDTVKNKTILIQFIMFPCMTVIMEKAVHIQGMTEHFFANLFAVMYIGMAPLTSIAALISEEKEKNTLRVLQMCNVKAFEYLLGNAIYIVSVCMIGSLVIGLAGGYTGIELLYFMVISFLGHNISVLLGAMIGLISRNQMAATSVSVPVMMIFSFLPMLSMFNQTIRNIAKYIYSEQLFVLINSLDRIHINVENIMILLCNIVIITALFLVTYRRIL
ncbi:MAG: ABC transporter permease [Coprococcus sp.]|nr:ABC transporter permease [Coprococcus sp.]